MSDLVPHMGGIADDITLIRSMHTGVNNHGQSIYALINGTSSADAPPWAVGSRMVSAAKISNLPAYVALTDPTRPARARRGQLFQRLAALRLPGHRGPPQRASHPQSRSPHVLKGEAQSRYLDFVNQLNREHLAARPGEGDLAARIQSFELAARMQTAAKEALDISQESEATKKLYGLDKPETEEFGTRCLIARRLVERGVRFVSIFTGNQTWDHHSSILKSCRPPANKSINPPPPWSSTSNNAACWTHHRALGRRDGPSARHPEPRRSQRPRHRRPRPQHLWLQHVGRRRRLQSRLRPRQPPTSSATKPSKIRSTTTTTTPPCSTSSASTPKKLSYKRNGTEQTLVQNPEARVVHDLLA
jgi:hypothetical protein